MHDSCRQDLLGRGHLLQHTLRRLRLRRLDRGLLDGRLLGGGRLGGGGLDGHSNEERMRALEPPSLRYERGGSFYARPLDGIPKPSPKVKTPQNPLSAHRMHAINTECLKDTQESL